MRRMIAAFLAAGAALLAPLLVAVEPAHAATGFHVRDGRLLDANGNDFVMRGVSHAHTWYPTRTSSFAGIKSLGANTVRVVLSSGDRWTRNDATDVANVVSLCKQNRLVCVLEVHDTTGYGEQSGAATLAQAVDYWISIRSALAGQESYVIVNIGNEPYGNSNYSTWTTDTIQAINRLRDAGFEHTLMVDAPNWGQDWSFTMRDNAARVLAGDPARNTVFSIHMYGVFDTAAEVTDYLGRFVSARLPIVVGEFGHDHSDGNPDEDTIMATAQTQRLGYIGWSWSGNSSDVAYLDMVNNFDAGSLTPWGQRIFNGANGIRQTAREASVYGGGGGDVTPPTAPGTPTAANTAADRTTLSWAPATDAVGVAAYDVVRVSGTTETVVATSTTTSATVTGLSAATTYTFAVYARDAAGNRSPRSGTVTVTTPTGSGGPTTGCAVTYRVVGQWNGGFQGEVVVRNTGTTQIDGWTLRWTFADGQTVSSMWGGSPSQSGSTVTVTNAGYTARIPVNGSVGIGFTGTWTGRNTAPTAFTLNGSACGTA